MLFSFDETIRQTIKLILTESGKNWAKTGKRYLAQYTAAASRYSYFHDLPNLTIKVNSFDDLNKSMYLFLNQLVNITKALYSLQIEHQQTC